MFFFFLFPFSSHWLSLFSSVSPSPSLLFFPLFSSLFLQFLTLANPSPCPTPPFTIIATAYRCLPLSICSLSYLVVASWIDRWFYIDKFLFYFIFFIDEWVLIFMNAVFCWWMSFDFEVNGFCFDFFFFF